MEVVMIGNEKGGVGKTALTRCLGEALTTFGYKVLIVDWDPSGNLTDSILPDFPELVLYDAFCGNCTAEQVIQKTPIGDILPTIKELDFGDTPDGTLLLETNNKSLTNLANRLFGRAGGESQLKSFLWSQKNNFAAKYDFVLVDTGPSDNILVTNAIVAANTILMACDPALASLSGVWKLLSSMNTAKRCYVGATATLDGVVITKYSERKGSFAASIREIRSSTSAQEIYLYQTVMRDSGHVSAAMNQCCPLMHFAKQNGNGVSDMLNLGLEFLAARNFAPRVEIPGLQKDANENWIYVQPTKNTTPAQSKPQEN